MGHTVLDLLSMYDLALSMDDSLSDQTKTGQRSQLKQFTDWIRNKPELHNPKRIEEIHIQLFMQHRKEECGIGKGTLRLQHIVLDKFFKWAKQRKLIKKNPMKGLNRPKYRLPKVDFPEEDSIDLVIAACDGETFLDIRDRFIITALKETGVRAREILKTTEFDWDEIQRTVVVHGKGDKIRVVPFGHATVVALIDYKDIRKEHYYAHLDQFLIGQKGKLGYGGLRGRMVTRCKQAGVEFIRCHRMRHAFVHKAKESGVSPDALQALAGWESLFMYNHYAASMNTERALNEYRNKME